MSCLFGITAGFSLWMLAEEFGATAFGLGIILNLTGIMVGVLFARRGNL